MSNPRTSILKHWYWVWLISAFFVTVMIVFYFARYPRWFHLAYHGISLTHEMNYAVWWSGICLFMAGIVFARVGVIAEQVKAQPWVWYVMSLGMVALCFDEVGSLHEVVSRLGGWEALLPFALIFAIVFGFALFNLVRNRDTRVVAVLIMLGLGIFVLVAGLEFLEHDVGFQGSFWRRLRLVGEEAMELVAMGILISAGLMAMRKFGDGDRRVGNVMSVVERLYAFPFAVFALFVLQIVFTAALVTPNYTYFPEGNPASLFPVLLFFCLGVLAWQRSTNNKLWKIQALVFLLASILQMYNLNEFINNVLDVSVNLFIGPRGIWAVTLVPFAALGIYAVNSGRQSWGRVLTYLVLFGLVILLVYPDLKLRFRREYLYFLYSSCVAFSCYQLMASTISDSARGHKS